MSQFDLTTENLRQQSAELGFEILGRHEDWAAGRNSAKESMENLARALEAVRYSGACFCAVSIGHPNMGGSHANSCRVATEAIDKVKARGDWPLEGN